MSLITGVPPTIIGVKVFCVAVGDGRSVMNHLCHMFSKLTDLLCSLSIIY